MIKLVDILSFRRSLKVAIGVEGDYLQFLSSARDFLKAVLPIKKYIGTARGNAHCTRITQILKEFDEFDCPVTPVDPSRRAGISAYALLQGVKGPKRLLVPALRKAKKALSLVQIGERLKLASQRP